MRPSCCIGRGIPGSRRSTFTSTWLGRTRCAGVTRGQRSCCTSVACWRPGARGAHRRKRPHRPLPGMTLHPDASRHAWVAGLPACDLVVTLDGATRRDLRERFWLACADNGRHERAGASGDGRGRWRHGGGAPIRSSSGVAQARRSRGGFRAGLMRVQVLCEFTWVLRRLCRYRDADVAASIRRLCASEKVVYDHATVEGPGLPRCRGRLRGRGNRAYGTGNGRRGVRRFDRQAIRLATERGHKAAAPAGAAYFV
jgi:hypothetical protein